jgi:hypothetical protein
VEESGHDLISGTTPALKTSQTDQKSRTGTYSYMHTDSKLTNFSAATQ